MHQPQSTGQLEAKLSAVRVYGARQSLAHIQRAQEMSSKLLDEIADGFKPGMTESEAQAMADAVFQKHAVVKRWHKPYIRFGNHTVFTFLDPPPEEDNILRDEDIVFVDIGPVFDIDGKEIEGDVGASFHVGYKRDDELYTELVRASHAIFESAVQYWHERKPTGIELYQYIHQATEAAGFVFNLPEAGHLIGTFPHSKNNPWREGLNHYPEHPQAGVWIVEVQIRHPELPYGAFFEDVLL